MAKKKVQYPNRKRNNILTGFVSVVIIAALVVAVSLNVMARDWVLKIDGNNIKTNEYKLSLAISMSNYSMYRSMGYEWNSQIGENGETLLDYAKNDAINMIINQNIITKECNNRGLTNTEEQITEAKESFDLFWESLSDAAKDDIGMSKSKIIKYFEESMLGDVLYEEETKHYVFDEAEEESAKTYYENYLVENKTSVVTYNIDYVLTDDEVSADWAREKIERGEDFYGVIQEFEYGINPSDEVADEPVVDGAEVDEPIVDEPVVEEPAEVHVHEEGEEHNHDHDHDHAAENEVAEGHVHDENCDHESEEPELEDPRMAPVPAAGVAALSTVIDKIYEMSEGQLSEVIEIVVSEGDEETGDLPVYKYAVVRVDSIVEPDYEALKEEQKEAYIKGVKDGMANEAVTKIMEVSDIYDSATGGIKSEIINTDKINAIDVSKFM